MVDTVNNNYATVFENDAVFAKPFPPPPNVTHLKIRSWSLTGSKIENEVENDLRPYYLIYSMVDHDYFDSNLLLMPNFTKEGCKCHQLKTPLNFVNPFFGNPFVRMMVGKENFKNHGYINQTEALKQHDVDFHFDDLFYAIVKRCKPTIYVSELVKGTKDTVGCTYSLKIKLVKNRRTIQMYKIERFFEKIANDHFELNIIDYPDFDKLCICHCLTASTLSTRKVYSIKVGKTVVKVLSETIEPPVVFDDE